MSEWKDYKINDIVEKICVGFVGPCQKFYCEADKGVPMLRTTNLTERNISYNDVKYVTHEFHNKNKKSQLKYGDILVARHGDNGKACMYLSNDEANCLNAVIIRPDNLKINPRFFLYQFNSPIIRGTIGSMSSGSVQDVINTKQIAQLEIPLPNREIQDKITELLSSLDDKIDLLHRQNKTLEQLAETLFRQWFVEEAEDSWEVEKFENIIDVVGGYNHKLIDIADSGDYLLSMGSIIKNYGISFNATHSIKENIVDMKYLCRNGDIVITTRDITQDADLLGSPGIIPRSLTNKKVFVGSNLYKIVLKSDKINGLILYWLLRSNPYRKFVKEYASGTSVLMLKKSDLLQFSFRLPPKMLLRKLEIEIEELTQKLENNQNQILTLTQLRDTLLPKLMSGEVRVNN